MVVIGIPKCVQMNGTAKEPMLHATTLMSQNTVTWNAMLDVVLTISVMGLRVVYLVEAHCGWY
jgi:hypothetical protein